MLALGYITNGFAHHTLEDAIDLLADLGYAGIGISLDVHHLHPFRSDAAEVARVRARLERRGLRAGIETGARYLLDPRAKHEPTLLSSEGRERRLAFLERALEIGRDLGAESVALFSGVRPEGLPEGDAWRRLEDGLAHLLDRQASLGAPPLAFEPEPGHLVSDLAGYDRLRASLGDRLRLTLDLGHVLCTERVSIPEAVRSHGRHIANVHVEDIRGRVHEHLPFGEGQLDLPPALAALEEIGYRGLVHVELSRNSHDAPHQARRSIDLLRKAQDPWRST